ncbi:MAG: hypothetical protein ABIA63_03555 [bacterium]
MNIYIELTKDFNSKKLRCILSSGQAVVLHRLAIMSKDGDWILKEDKESIQFVLDVLSGYNARYRFGAPLDIRWLSEGWSAHFEFSYNELRVRTDFVTRPPRITPDELAKLWAEQEQSPIPFIDAVRLADIKKTNREKDYVVIGELARQMAAVNNQFLYSRSARDLTALAEKYPDILNKCVNKRPLLKRITDGLGKLETELDAEKRKLIHLNEDRLSAYINAARDFRKKWLEIEKEVKDLPLRDAHHIIVSQAEKFLPFRPGRGYK